MSVSLFDKFEWVVKQCKWPRTFVKNVFITLWNLKQQIISRLKVRFICIEFVPFSVSVSIICSYLENRETYKVYYDCGEKE